MKKKGFTLIELLVVIAIIAMLLAILMPAMSKVKKIAARVICGTNLKGLGTAQTVYANDFADEYTVQGKGAAHIWNDRTVGWEATTKNWATPGNLSVGASLYLLVRLADVSPKSFVCPSSSEKTFSGRNPNNLDITELWDFGNPGYIPPTGGAEGPALCVSYSYHEPYTATGRSVNAAKTSNNASFAAMADRSPYFDTKSTQWDWTDETSTTIAVGRIGTYYISGGPNKTSGSVKAANAHPHDREGQNVLYADGHNSYENTADVGVMNDGIYTIRGGSGLATLEQIRGGYHNGNRVFNSAAGTPKPMTIQPLTKEDSFLVNDSRGGW